MTTTTTATSTTSTTVVAQTTSGEVDPAQTSVKGTTDGVNGSLVTDPLPVVYVNKANIGEIKGALDDIVKKVCLGSFPISSHRTPPESLNPPARRAHTQHLSAQSFTPSLLHPTVHLSLGYTSVAFALGSAGYAFKLSFEESKPVLWVGVIGYFVLQALLWAWKRWVEQGEVYSGKRRRVVKRVSEEVSVFPPHPAFRPAQLTWCRLKPTLYTSHRPLHWTHLP